MLAGVNQATFYVLPLLGEKHPESYPRFRDCFITKDDNGVDEIHVFTRVGGNNRGQGYGEEELYKHPNFLRTWDDDFDSTYATYAFSVPEEWKEDVKHMMSGGEMSKMSEAYKQRLYAVFPKLKEKFDEMFKPITDDK